MSQVLSSEANTNQLSIGGDTWGGGGGGVNKEACDRAHPGISRSFLIDISKLISLFLMWATRLSLLSKGPLISTWFRELSRE